MTPNRRVGVRTADIRRVQSNPPNFLSALCPATAGNAYTILLPERTIPRAGVFMECRTTTVIQESESTPSPYRVATGSPSSAITYESNAIAIAPISISRRLTAARTSLSE